LNTPYGIFEYQEDNLSAYIAYQTNTSFIEVKRKQQIKYINKYISDFLIGMDTKSETIVFIYENNYVDKHYLEDYTTYFSRCFTNYRKNTSRIHFFRTKKRENYKELLLNSLHGDSKDLSNDNYLGFIVLRPIPKTFLAKVCLKPYTFTDNRLRKVRLSTEYNVSLFGIKLKIDTVAFQEQDKVLSACATTALWSFFHAHEQIPQISLPSSSEITKNAYPEQNGYSREFPNVGLSTEMICRGIRNYKLVPEYFDLSKETNKISLLKELIFAYSSSGLPLILGLDVIDKNDKSKGLHAVTILGYYLDEKLIENNKLYAHSMKQIYVHDDRYGPFLRVMFDDEELTVQLENEDIGERYIPDTLIIGLYHKIRIPYISIATTCELLIENIKLMITMTKNKQTEELVDFANETQLLDKIQWDISIVQNVALKEEILKNENIYDKEYYLLQSWPKYIWNAKVYIDSKCECEFLFDATDIEQSSVYLDVILYDTQTSDVIFELLENYAKTTKDLYTTEKNHFLKGIKESLNKEPSMEDNLNILYGYLKIPEYIRDIEIEDDLIINQLSVRINSQEDVIDKDFKLDKNLNNNNEQYIWVIDKEGYLSIGVETIGSGIGHPTLTKGMPARIGGELLYENSKWIINSESGRFSKYEYTNEEREKYISNAMLYKFNVFFPKIKFEVQKTGST
jgi:hypothetical protein